MKIVDVAMGCTRSVGSIKGAEEVQRERSKGGKAANADRAAELSENAKEESITSALHSDTRGLVQHRLQRQQLLLRFRFVPSETMT